MWKRVPAGSLGDPNTFAWSMFTGELGPLGTDIASHVDELPDGGLGATYTWRWS